jgi:hypothetical protein
MYKLMTFATVLVALALAPVLSGMGGDARPRDPSGAGEVEVRRPSEAVSQQGVRAIEPEETNQTCEWSCRACAADQGCRQICTEIGDCGNSCGVTARCDARHEWSEDACACIAR